MAWAALLTGDLARRAREAVAELAAALADERRGPWHASLGGGFAGRAVFYGYLVAIAPDGDALDRAVAFRDRAVEEVAQAELPPGLFGGYAGVAWTVEHLERDAPCGGGDDDDDDAVAAVDDALVARLAISPAPDDHDLIRGLAGIGVHALERIHRPSARDCLARVVTRLAERGEPRGGGLAWRTRPEHLMPAMRAQFPDGLCNLGVAHGAPAVAVVLAGACAAGIEVARARPLLDAAMRWMLDGRLGEPSPSSFARWEVDGQPAMPARAAWCYGDPGVALALLVAARAVGEADWEREALAVARRAAARPIIASGVVDAGICHGAAGLALMFHRLWQVGGTDDLAEAARRWYAYALDLRRPGAGIAGYQSWIPATPEQPGQWDDDVAFLSGAAGIGLVLLAGLGVEPHWDRVLAASLPPRLAARATGCLAER